MTTTILTHIAAVILFNREDDKIHKMSLSYWFIRFIFILRLVTKLSF